LINLLQLQEIKSRTKNQCFDWDFTATEIFLTRNCKNAGGRCGTSVVLP
jgi:hypothetical protein